MTTAVDDRGDAHPRSLAAHVQRAHALGAVHQMRGAREQIDAHRLHVHGDLPDRLRGIGMEEDALALAQLADGADVLDGPDLVVGEHHGDQDRLVGQRLGDLLDVDQAVGLDRHVGDLDSLSLQALGDVEARALLDHRGDDVVALLAVHVGHALEGEVDRLGAAGRQHDLFGIASPDQRGELAARRVDRRLRLPSEGMVPAGRVTVLLREVGQHGLNHPRISRRGRLRVHEDRELHRHRSPLSSLIDFRSFHRSSRDWRAQPARVARLALPNCKQLGNVIGHQLGQAHRVEHLADGDLDLLHRPSQVAARHLRALTVALHALDDVDRALERPHHPPDSNLGRPQGQNVSAFRPVLADDQPLASKPLEDLREQLGWNPELIRDPLRAHRAVVLVDGDVVDRHQPVVGTLGKAKHRVPPV